MSRRPSFVFLAALALACGAAAWSAVATRAQVAPPPAGSTASTATVPPAAPAAPSSPPPAATGAPGLAATLDTGNQPVEPFRILGNLYYVGASDLAAFLIDTGSGLIVLDGGLATTAPQIRDNIVRLGKSPRDVKILLNSHAHLDHAGGLAQLRAWTGAQLVASERDAPGLASGGRDDATLGADFFFPPVRPDRLVRDGDRVTLGATVLTAHLTPGHTPGCTTWTTRVEDGGKAYDVVFVGSATVLAQYRLVTAPTYPGIAADFAHTFAVLKALPCDVFLGSHASFYDGLDKARRLRAGETPNPFLDAQGYRAWVDNAESAYRQRLAAETAARP
jgi:metallo-beta-lactamase class B